jgi:putative ABC transport system substrate-binding protein
MKRREFILALGGVAAASSNLWSLAARAQQADQVRRIGVLSNIGESDLEAQSMATALHEGLRELGWVDGRNLQVVHRWAQRSKEIAPGISRIAFLFNPQTAPYVTRFYQGPMEASGASRAAVS